MDQQPYREVNGTSEEESAPDPVPFLSTVNDDNDDKQSPDVGGYAPGGGGGGGCNRASIAPFPPPPPSTIPVRTGIALPVFAMLSCSFLFWTVLWLIEIMLLASLILSGGGVKLYAVYCFDNISVCGTTCMHFMSC